MARSKGGKNREAAKMEIEWGGSNHFMRRYGVEETCALRSAVFESAFKTIIDNELALDLTKPELHFPDGWETRILKHDVQNCCETDPDFYLPPEVEAALPDVYHDILEDAHIINDQLQCLFEVLIERGCMDMLALPMDLVKVPREQPIVGFLPLREHISALYVASEHPSHVYLSSREADWGIVSINTEGAILGAEPALMAKIDPLKCRGSTWSRARKGETRMAAD